MRCKNCGWPNKPNATTCSKCNSPLSDNDFDNGFSGQPSQHNEALNKTIYEGASCEPHTPPMPTDREEDFSQKPATCPKCGYPVRPGVEKCPNCKYQINSHNAGPSTDSHQEYPRQGQSSSTRRPTRMTSADDSQPKFRGTINPYMMNVASDPSFLLKPIKRVDERHELEELEFEGSEVVLNRNNTESNNPSITSRQQAIVTNKDGHWYIEDKSEQKTTFVQASGPIELHDGDIILLGNRLFEFKK